MNASPTEIRRRIVRKLRNVIDPELGVNIIDLGLVYNILFDDGRIIVEYTTTTPGCPMRRFLQQQVEKALDEIGDIPHYEARLIHEPVWTVEMIVPDVEFFAVPPPQLG